VRGVWRLPHAPCLIQIPISDDLCALVRDRHSRARLRFVELADPPRSRGSHRKAPRPIRLLDKAAPLPRADAVLVSLMGGEELLTMADVNRVMEQIGRCCERAKSSWARRVGRGK